MTDLPGRHGPRARLPRYLLLVLLAAVAVGYALLLEADIAVLITVVLLVSLIGAVLGMAVRDSHERPVTVGHSLGEALRRLGRTLWP